MTSLSLAPVWKGQTPYQIALEASQRLHWSVIPLDEDKRPPKVGGFHHDGTPKRLAWKAFQRRCASAGEIRHWQKIHHPPAWAVVTGQVSGLLILDFDREEGKQTCQQLGLNPHVQTGSGGYHVYFKHPSWHVPTLNSASTKELGQRWPGLDIRADGGYGAFCGGNVNGPYLWLREPLLEEVDILPQNLRAFLGLLAAPETKPSERRTSSEP